QAGAEGVALAEDQGALHEVARSRRVAWRQATRRRSIVHDAADDFHATFHGPILGLVGSREEDDDALPSLAAARRTGPRLRRAAPPRRPGAGPGRRGEGGGGLRDHRGREGRRRGEAHDHARGREPGGRRPRGRPEGRARERRPQDRPRRREARLARRRERRRARGQEGRDLPRGRRHPLARGARRPYALAMAQRRISWRVVVALGAMLAAILAYVASLDDTDPDPL